MRQIAQSVERTRDGKRGADKRDDALHDQPLGCESRESWPWRWTNSTSVPPAARVTFQNGDPMTSDDFKFTFFDRIRADTTLGLAASWNNALEAIETPSPTKAVMHFRNPFPAAPQLLGDGTGYVLPRNYFEKVGRQGFIDKPIGSGPYRLVGYERDSRIVLEAYDKHWNAPPKIKNVVFQIIKDEQTANIALRKGEIDLVMRSNREENLAILEKEGFKLNKVENYAVALQVANMKNKYLSDVRVRQALAYGVDWEAIIKATAPTLQAPAHSMLMPWMDVYTPDVKRYPFDPALAKKK